jgi:MurNAc alpha-1-phosphate uridylyltransferase
VHAEPLPPVCILAGGRGTRLGELTQDVPKPLLVVAGEPFLIHQLRALAAHGVERVVLCVGYRGELIESRVGPERFGVNVSYSYDSPDLDGTLGAIRRALPLLGERFLILYGDSYLRLDYQAANRGWRESRLPALMAVLRNEGCWDVSNALYAHKRVLVYDKQAPRPDMSWIDYGLGGLTADALQRVACSESELAVLYTALARRGELYGHEAAERFYEIGTPSAMQEADAFLRGEPR